MVDSDSFIEPPAPSRVLPSQSSFSSRMELSAFIEETSSDVDHYFSNVAAAGFTGRSVDNTTTTSGQHTSSSAGKSIDTGYQSNIILGQTGIADPAFTSDVGASCHYYHNNDSDCNSDRGLHMHGVADMSVDEGAGLTGTLQPHLQRLDDTGMRCD